MTYQCNGMTYHCNGMTYQCNGMTYHCYGMTYHCSGMAYHCNGMTYQCNGMTYHCNGMTYDNAYLITFIIGPLRTHTLAPSILPLLEAPAQGFLWNLPEFGCRIRFVFHGC